MSRTYQGLIILNTKGTEGSVDELIKAVGKEIEAEGAKIGNVEQLGRRKFAYESRHLEAGHYVNIRFEVAPAAIDKIQARLRLSETVHQHYFSRVA